LYGFISCFGSYQYKIQYKVSNFSKNMPEVSQNRPKYANCIPLNAECLLKKVNKKTKKKNQKNCGTFVGENRVTRDYRLTPGPNGIADRGPIT
jgi:hypothetical protein